MRLAITQIIPDDGGTGGFSPPSTVTPMPISTQPIAPTAPTPSTPISTQPVGRTTPASALGTQPTDINPGGLLPTVKQLFFPAPAPSVTATPTPVTTAPVSSTPTAPASSTSTGATGGGASDGGDAINRLIDLVAAQYAGAGVSGGDQSFGGLVTAPIDTATTQTPATSSHTGAIAIVILIGAALAFWYYKKHKKAKAA